MGIREERQEEAVRAFLNSDNRSIINACPRFGKIKVAIDIMTRRSDSNVLIVAPRTDIFKGWISDFKKFGKHLPAKFEYSTFASIKKLSRDLSRTLVIIDEPHELSVNQQVALSPICSGIPTLGLTGTMTNKTRNELYDNLTLDTCYEYSIDDGVQDGILADYQLFIHKVSLFPIERRKFSRMSYSKSKSENPLQQHFITLKMINVIQNSIAKTFKTKELLREFKDERILVFCGVTKVADSLGIPVYHSKSKEKAIFTDFCNGISINQLATIKMMQAGITITPISKGIINYMSGNPEDGAQKICRFLGFEYDTPDKSAEIHIISSNEPFELGRLKTALAFFDTSKITFI